MEEHQLNDMPYVGNVSKAEIKDFTRLLDKLKDRMLENNKINF